MSGRKLNSSNLSDHPPILILGVPELITRSAGYMRRWLQGKFLLNCCHHHFPGASQPEGFPNESSKQVSLKHVSVESSEKSLQLLRLVLYCMIGLGWVEQDAPTTTAQSTFCVIFYLKVARVFLLYTFVITWDNTIFAWHLPYICVLPSTVWEKGVNFEFHGLVLYLYLFLVWIVIRRICG